MVETEIRTGTAGETRPRRDLAWLLQQSTAPALATAAVGAASLAVVIVGTLVRVSLGGWVPLRDEVAALTSSGLRALLVAAIVLGVAASAAGWSTYRRMPTRTSREEAVAGAVLGLQGVILGALILVFSYGNVERIAANYLRWSEVTDQVGAFLNGAKITLLLAIGGEFLGVILGVILAIFLISKRATVRAPARAYVNLFRGTPLLLQIAFIGLALPLGFNVHANVLLFALVAFTLNTGAYSAEVFRAGIQSIERGQMEAARGLGMTYLQAMRYAIIPQAVRRIIPPLMNEFVILIKDTSLIVVLGLTAGQRDLFNVGYQGYGNSFNATFYIFAGLGYLIVTLPLIRLVNWVEKRMRSGLVGVTGL